VGDAITVLETPSTPWHASAVADEDEDPYAWLKAPLKAIQEMIPERYPLLRLAIPTQVLTLTVAFVLTRIFDIETPPIRCEMPFWRAVGLMVGLEVAFLVVFVSLKRFVKEMKLPGYLEKLLQALKKTTPGELAVVCLSVGFVEEVAFRGVLLPLVGPVISTALFGLAHRPRILFHWAVLCGIATLFIIEMRLTGGLLLPIVHHALHDLWALGLLYVVLRNDPDGTVEGL
jgi:membrane protease YdiL (CAAX protease family)